MQDRPISGLEKEHPNSRSYATYIAPYGCPGHNGSVGSYGHGSVMAGVGATLHIWGEHGALGPDPQGCGSGKGLH